MNTFTQLDRAHQREEHLRAWNKQYAAGDPQVSDAVFDQEMREHASLRAVIPADKFPNPTILDEVGAAIASKRRVKHETPMLSLDNVFEAQPGTLEAWLAKTIEQVRGHAELISKNYHAVAPAYICCEPKVDGVALKLIYRLGGLFQACTRGDGEWGEDVTDFVAQTNLVPLRLRAALNCTITGEVYMPTHTFAARNKARAEAGLPLWKNPRNVVAGTLALADWGVARERGLQFIAHGMDPGDAALLGIHSQTNFAQFMTDEGVTAVPSWNCASDATDTPAVDFAKHRMQMDNWVLPTDGLVFKVDDFRVRQMMGDSTRSPRWAVAYKFLPEQATTTVNAIIAQVGRTGKLTPVAQLEPVMISGSEVSNASLHNEDQINRLGVRVGDRVTVHKAAEIIPEIVASLTNQDLEKDGTKRLEFSLVEHLGGRCPSCSGMILEQRRRASMSAGKLTDTTVNWFCGNSDCPAQLAGKIEHFCSRKALDVSCLGEALAVSIASGLSSERHRVPGNTNVAALLRLFDEDATYFANFDWETERGISRLGVLRGLQVVQGFQRARRLPLHRWLYALGIPSIGEGTSKEIARIFEGGWMLEALAAEDKTVAAVRAIYAIIAGDKVCLDLRALDVNTQQLGSVSAHSLIKFIQSPDGKLMLKFMAENKIVSSNFKPRAPAGEASPPLSGSGKVFVITGMLSKSRDLIAADIEAAGGKVGSSVSAKTDYLVLGANGGSKQQKAEKLKVPTISEEQLRDLIGATP